MTELFDAAQRGNLERVRLLVEQGTDKNQIGGEFEETALSVAAYTDKLDVVRFLVEQGADMEKADSDGKNSLMAASMQGHLDVARYLLEQGANRDKATNGGYTSLHYAAYCGHLEIAKLLMVYGADLNARNMHGELPIDMGYRNTEEIRQAIRDEPRRRMDHGHKRATEQDRHPNALASASAQQQDDEKDGDDQISKKPRLDDGTCEVEGKVAEEDEPSEPSDEEV